jgi:hypothetical protein
MGLFVDLGDRCGDFLRIGFAVTAKEAVAAAK